MTNGCKWDCVDECPKSGHEDCKWRIHPSIHCNTESGRNSDQLLTSDTKQPVLSQGLPVHLKYSIIQLKSNNYSKTYNNLESFFCIHKRINGKWSQEFFISVCIMCKNRLIYNLKGFLMFLEFSLAFAHCSIRWKMEINLIKYK